MRLTDLEKQQLLQEFMDEDKVILVCGRHNIAPGPEAGSPRPVGGCKDCWQVYWIKTVARIPPDERQEWLAKIHQTLNYMNEAIERGEWSFTPFAHPEITTEEEEKN